MSQFITPGVYVVEQNAFPNSVVPVPTAIPVFIGYTAQAKRDGTDLTYQPTEIGSLAEYTACFGGSPAVMFEQCGDQPGAVCAAPFLMHRSMMLFFANGGGNAYVVSVGSFTTDGAPLKPDKDAIIAALVPLETTPNPAMVLTPDTALMSLADWSAVTKAVLRHCKQMQSRIAILDLVNGEKRFGQPAGPDPVRDFRANLGSEGLDYAAAYYPWVNTVLIDRNEISHLWLSEDLRAQLRQAVEDEADAKANAGTINAEVNLAIKALAVNITMADTTVDTAILHDALTAYSMAYAGMMDRLCTAANLMPPGSAIAGLIARHDKTNGPWKAPANITMQAVLSPAFGITDAEQDRLNDPHIGLAVNPIRSFPQRGVMVWGARLLDSHHADIRYVSDRRTMIMIEQSVKNACAAYVFEANAASTWASVKAIVENFLSALWMQGAFQGAAPQEAFFVSIGLGKTMVNSDIEDGIMIIQIGVALLRPAEFQIVTIKQSMPKP